MSVKILPIIPIDTCTAITNKVISEFILHGKKSPIFFEDWQVPGSVSLVTDKFPSITRIYKNTTPPITDDSLQPSQWFGRLYLKGNVLERHIDGPHCDHSYTITVGHSGESNWPIFIDGIPYEIPIGHGAYYRGCDMEHWREELKSTWHIQLFFHYSLYDWQGQPLS